MFAFLKNLFRHNCENHKKIIMQEFYQFGDTGQIIKTDEKYECRFCGKEFR